MIAFSPGLAQGCFDLIEIASHQMLSFNEVRTAFATLGAVSSEKVAAASQVLGWLRSDQEGRIVVTPSGARLNLLAGYEPKLRQSLLDYIEKVRPPWIQNALSGRARVLSFVGSEIGQVFVEAGLAHGVDDEIVDFWDALASRARGQKDERLTAIGRHAEKLTLKHEERRTGRKPKWVSIDSNADGYDVLSVVERADAQRLSIEVKASTLGTAGTFHLTRNEWERATESEAHVFHLWDVRSTERPMLAAITHHVIQPHVPVNSGSGEWEIVEIPFAAFREKFAVPLCI